MTRKKIDAGLLVIDALLIIVTFLAVFPVLNLLSISFSGSKATDGVLLIARNVTLDAYRYVLKKPILWTGMWVSLKRVAVGTAVQFVVTVLCAYALSKSNREFKGRTVYAWFFFLTMLFDGGVVPFYMMVRQLKLLNSFWSLIIPGAVPVFHIILLLNFFKQIPRELWEAAMIDGAGHFKVLLLVYVPLSAPALATITLFSVVAHWNSWFDGMIFINMPEEYPLQTYLQSVLAATGSNAQGPTSGFTDTLNARNTRAALIIVAMLPLILLYPALDKYLAKGIVMGGVKG